MKKTALSTAISGVISMAVVPLLFSNSALAQNDELSEEEVLVTGSRIARPSLESSVPLQILNSQDINLGAETNIGEFLNQLPAVGTPTFSRTNSNFDISNSGVVNIDLRGLGISRTLTLVNGRRFVAGVPNTSAVDLNAIPSAMIERAEISTGGSSAIYGSDAVAGVVNFILKDDFEGVEITSRYEITDESDGEEYDIGVLIGSNFADDKGNAIAFIGYTDQGPIFSRDRERTAIDAVAPVALGGTDVFGQTRPFFSSFPIQGRFDAGNGGTAANYTFAPDGTLINSFDTNGANGPANGFNRSAFRTIAIPTERFLASTNVHYNFNESLRGFFESTYTTTRTQAALEPVPLDSNNIFLANTSRGVPLQYENSAGTVITNPFIPAAILADATTNNLDGIRFRRRLAEFGPRLATNERQTFRFATGLDGEISNWRWGVNYTYGQTTQAQRSQGNVDTTAFRLASIVEADPDNAGGFRCVDSDARAAGCAPLNVFGFNSISQEAINYVTADQSRNARIEQNVFQFNVSGELFELPAGPLAIAVGYERRLEKSEAINDSLTVRGLNSSNASPSVAGQFDVADIYAEVNIPILQDTVVDYLGLSLAGRTSDYSTVGDVGTYEGKLDLKIDDNFLVRGSYSRAVRAPNIDDLFDPGTQTFAQVNDPCAGITAASTGVIATNCLSIPAIAQRVADTGSFTLTQTELQGTTGFIGGNPDLTEEEADTFTYGIVHTPTYLPDSVGLSVAVDYWDIDVQDAILAISQNNVLNLCFNDADFPNNPLCNNIVRFDATSTERGALDEVNSGSANIGSITTSGVDVDLNLTLDLEPIISLPGTFAINTVYTHVNEYDIISLPGADPDNEVGEIENARNRLVSNFRYNYDNLSVQWQFRYIHQSRIEDQDLDIAACATLDCVTGAVTYSDIQIRYNIQSLIDGDLEVFGGVENVFDKEPPVISAGLSDSNTGAETNAGVYDAIGRAFYVGIRAKF